MKLLFLCKRRPMSRDLIERPYGRFYYLPKLLAQRGHDVTVALLDYRRGADVVSHVDGVEWLSRRPGRYLSCLRSAAAARQADWIIGLSDTWFGILAAGLARRHSSACCIDAYDNYESYIGWARPLHWLWRRALRRADLITAAGPALAALMQAGGSAASAVVPMAADPVGFEPRDRAVCRDALGLPADGPLVGYCGSMHRSRGVDVLFDAIPEVQARIPEVHFVHSGRTWADVPLPAAIQSLGYIDDGQVPLFLGAMDVLVVLNRPSDFGHHSYPVKLYEAMRCDVPVVATRTLATEWILREHPEQLVDAENPSALAAAIVAALRRRRIDYGALTDWESSCDLFERALFEARRELPSTSGQR